ncbi:helix-turn-helix domain-containing protein [Mesorhizobium sp. M2D.F.Ca.ET.185.01.1.1]|uniref:Crp/Fnr family transcriptional regulator n=1 Tax=unclassified Mesorhizobium TaxID=325217 RepID=UPI000FC9FD23|nr:MULTISPECIES: helix-turn-helix domain-containing protein [unclassified Mesorhizobium]TGP77435.1 helix-turn-helix domain-containing protein [bacterium M00.F.Ca.ET.227.01.1.1]TGP93230.1 helix-turn-helix domain-containing protein [bacterium M00.F.Ca.ET.222.01.1.1]TGP96776.1 helix-turn-helix domain-containing protein [bacterium M00.F.Ca.ET.221.01.1.1]TGU21193.1 helix-turn-helix domain-containing protein [bacterium M00.F.Ca.ET.156.01.1.1]TGU49988.1 helix-turn-helix domain-containing protein [bac
MARLAHLFCELAARLQMVGLVENGRFELPLTQSDFADACGLSIVHANRMLMELPRRELIEFQHRHVRILHPHALKEIAEFDPAYLHAL